MNMKKIIFCFIIMSSVFMKEASHTLILSPYSTIDSQYLDEGDISTINMLFISGLEQYIDSTHSSSISCDNDECALEELSKTNNKEVIYTRLQKLGSKIIFLASILDENKSFDSKATAMNVEDMEQVCLRLSKSIALRQTLDESADIENITDQDQEESARRTSLGRFGASLGYLFPLSDLTYSTSEWDGTFTDREYSQLFKFNLNYYNEFKNNTALLFELGAAPPVVSFLDLNFLKFTNKVDTSPFYGSGIGFYMVTKNNDYFTDDRHDGGMSLNLQGGVLLYRTYDLNVLLRIKYIHILNDEKNNGITFDIGIQWKRKERKHTKTINRYPLLERIFDRD